MDRISNLYRKIKKVILIIAPLGCLIAAPVQAVVINFDELEYIPSDPVFDFFADHPIAEDEYLDQGVRIVDGYLGEWWSTKWAVSGPNYLMAGSSASLEFVGGRLPVFVSMYVTAFSGAAGFIQAYGPDGWTELKQTPGQAGPNTKPFRGKNLVSFYSAGGIEKVDMWSYWGSRVTVAVDDLTYEYAVPEPSPLALIFAGLGLVFLRTRRRPKITGSKINS